MKNIQRAVIGSMLSIGALGCVQMTGCATTDFYGDAYPVTSHVDIFWDQSDVQRQYRVIGRAVTSEGFGSSEDMVASIREEAMSKGAHGVIITSMGSIETGHSETGKANDDWRHTTIDREERIESKFIRYID